ncbi:uncharacterized protein LOC111610387 isoform X2 [Xiphophorus maculatus]|uniref:uncharacterized protein LOC111610387 isoform X2 n=1 Tax=Xiphophorus maculatus TaxID=8083 RepID=UPI000C6E5EB0|nr:uncharacterized protein LOC111610387 isoform X2 [Xiphophorus maculatus]
MSSDMRTPSVCLAIGLLLTVGPTVSAVSLRVSPDLQQFFRDQSVNLSCEDPLDSVGLVVKKMTGGPSASCGVDFGRLSSPSSCCLWAHQDFSGSYWCETRTGVWSDRVNITASGTEPLICSEYFRWTSASLRFCSSDKRLILQIPALPVRTGSDVTLNCTGKNQRAVAAYFFFNGHLVGSDLRENLVLQNLQPSDEGSYWCSTDEFGSSLKSLLRVRGSPTPNTFWSSPAVHQSSLSPPSNSSILIPVLSTAGSLVSLVLVVLLFLLVLLVLVVSLGPWKHQEGRKQQCLPGGATSTQVVFRPSANGIPFRRSHDCPVQSEMTSCRYSCSPSGEAQVFGSSGFHI